MNLKELELEKYLIYLECLRDNYDREINFWKKLGNDDAYSRFSGQLDILNDVIEKLEDILYM